MKIIQKGAEAVISLENPEGGNIVLKERISKGYRLPQIDERIRSQRTRAEASLLQRASRSGVNVPRVWDSEGYSISMEYIEGPTLKGVLNDLPKKEMENSCLLAGEALGKLHSANIMHGDFTTSNMIMKGKKLYVIDFGLGRFTHREEDYAVDLYLLHEALKAAHFQILEEVWKFIIKAYKDNYTNSRIILKRLEKIESRRRYK